MIDVYTDELRDLIGRVKEAHNCKNVILLMSQEPSDTLRKFAEINGYKLHIIDDKYGLSRDLVYILPEIGDFKYEYKC